ncbi:MAG: hypothetical protein WEE89_01495 [Gemmatimonadota bacterium]
MLKTGAAVSIACAMVLAANLRGNAMSQEADILQRLTPPPTALPASCRLRPAIGKDALYGHNPAIVTDSVSISIVHMYATGAGVAAERPVAAGYTASYLEEGGSPQIGVYALRFRRDLTTPETETFQKSYGGGSTVFRLVKGAVAIYAYTNARRDAPDRGCFDALKKHLEAVDLK